MRRGSRLCWRLTAVFWLSGGVVLGREAPSAPLAPLAPLGVRPAIVFVVDGAGGFEATSRTLCQTVAEEKLPLEVRGFHWTHGYLRVLADQIHVTHIRREGQRLTELIQNCRQESPGVPIYLIGHSAGCGVVLIAAEKLPPNTLERIVLMAPAVSAKHDLRPALLSACQGMDVFISSRDWACLGLGTFLTGTTDRCWFTGAAGKIGFQPILPGPSEEALYVKLRQYPWAPQLACAGHNGGHYGSYQPSFLRLFVLPLLTANIAEPRP